MTEIAVARGIGPPAFRRGLAVIAGLYYVALNKQPPQLGGLHAITFFSEATCLFPDSSTYAIEFRLEAWSCADAAWRPLDPRPAFPIEADSKESRFQRIAYFYQHNHAVLEALDEWFVDRDDTIGGIRVVKVVRPIPQVGEDVPRYQFRPLDPIPTEERRNLYAPSLKERHARCRAHQ